MPRNRRNSTSMKYAVGQGCFLFLAAVLGVGFSVTKIIVGSEYVSHCPSREMIPVYVIVSGCLPVLLSALRQPYDGEQASEKERWSAKVTLFTAVIGVMVNLAWLVAGTYLVVTTWNGNLCNTVTPVAIKTSLFPEFTTTPTINGTIQLELFSYKGTLSHSSTEFPKINATDVNLHGAEVLKMSPDPTSASEDINKVTEKNSDQKKMENERIKRLTHNDSSPSQKETTEHTVKSLENVNDTNEAPVVNEEVKTKSDVTDTSNEESLNEHENNGDNADKIGRSHDNSQGVATDSTVSKTVTQFKNVDISTKSATIVDKSADKFTDKYIRINKVQSEVKHNSELTESSQDKHCITCDIHVLRFSLAVVIIDWTFVIFGIIYFCHFVYYRFASIKDQLLLINA